MQVILTEEEYNELKAKADSHKINTVEKDNLVRDLQLFIHNSLLTKYLDAENPYDREEILEIKVRVKKIPASLLPFIMRGFKHQ